MPSAALTCHHASVAVVSRVREIETPSGPARAHVSRRGPDGHGRAKGPNGLAVLGHGAGGGVEAPDLLAVTQALLGLGWAVARVEQPYRVAGRRAPEAAPRLDAAWLAAVRVLRGPRRGPLLVGGRSSGARVACRTAGDLGADAVVALAFPLHPPGRPERSRAEELGGVAAPVLVVQGDRDPFGVAADILAATRGATAGRLAVRSVPGDHSLRRAPQVIGSLVEDWLAGIGLSADVLQQS
jgi:uncharacterized protein